MGLRINTNIPVVSALRNLTINDRNQQRTLERLATGLRINKASDDPSGLVISEELRQQISALNQATENSINGSNLINVADSALQEVSNLLVKLQEAIVFAQSSGSATPDQIAAEQDTVDQAIAAIDRIGATTRYGERELLNGSAGFQFTGTIPDLLDDITIRTLDFPGDAASRNLRVLVTRSPQRASIRIDGATTTAGATIRVTGERGSYDVVLGSSTSTAGVASGINSVAGFTGVYASATGGNVLLRSEEFGNEQLIRIQGVSGVLSSTGSNFQVLSGTALATVTSVGSGLGAGEVVSDRGLDGQVTFEGQTYTGVGREFRILSRTAQFEFNLDPELLDDTPSIALPSPASATLTIGNTGLDFQVHEKPLPSDRITFGISQINSFVLGLETTRDRIGENSTAASETITQGGFLSSLKTGQGNDLTQNPGNANLILRGALQQVNSLRSFLGALDEDTLQPNIRSLGVEIENLSASVSHIRDLDFAAEVANFTRAQILFQSNVSVLANANVIPQSVLALLGAQR